MEIKKSIDQLPGTLAIWMIPLSNVEVLTETVIRVKDVNNVVKISPSSDSAHHVASRYSSRAGSYFEHKINFFIQGRSGTTDTLLQKTKKYKRFIALLQNENGTWQRVGEINQPCTMTGERSTQRPGYNFQITAKTTVLYRSAPFNTTTLIPILSEPPMVPVPPSPL